MKLIYCFLLLNTAALSAQESIIERIKPQVMSPSPTPSSLGKFADQPVSLYTGIPSIQIPLWEIKLNDFSLPIELNYHSGGVKVQEESSNVGMGWSLNAGGVITRAVRGNVPDDFAKGENQQFYQHSLDNVEFPTVGRFWTGKYEVLKNMDMDNTEDHYLDDQLGLAMANYPRGRYAFNGANDLEPDVFYYNFGNKSGKFVFDVVGNQQTIELIPHDDLKITHTLDANGEINSFTVIDENGIKYIFDTVERVMETQTNYSLADWQTRVLTYNSSWYLSKIITKNRQEITFTYVNEQMHILQETATSKTQTRVPLNPDEPQYNLITIDTNTYGLSITESNATKRLSRITSDNEIIDFGATSRLDVISSGLSNPQKAISSVTVYNNFFQLIKKFDFDQNYFVSPTAGVNTIYPSDFYRLKLNAVKESYGSSALKKYTFGYNSVPLPNKRSPRQDFWGYYNNNGVTEFNKDLRAFNMIPSVYVYPSLIGNQKYQLNPLCYPYNYTDSYIEPGADRNANPTYAQASILTSVTYPTGGRAEYTYESNDFLYGQCLVTGGGLRIKTIKNFEKGNTTSPLTVKNYSYLDAVGKSSGKVTAVPIFANVLERISTALYNFKNITSNSQSKLGTTNGSYVGYKRVTESAVGVGKTVYEYSTPGMIDDNSDPEYGLYEPTKITWVSPVEAMSTIPSAYAALKSHYAQNHLFPNNYPFPQNPEYDWNRGKLKKESYLNEAGDLLKEKFYNYGIYTKPGRPGKVFGLTYSTLIADPNGQYLFHYYIGLLCKYGYITNKANVLESIETKDYNGSGSFVSTLEKYKYTSAYHRQKTQDISYDSANREIRTEYQYAPDMLLAPDSNQQQRPFVEELTSLHSFDLVTTKKFVSNQKTHEDEIVFGEFATGQYLPQSIYSEKGSSGINLYSTSQRKIVFNQYDKFGNVTQYTPESGVPVAVIWGYNNKYPIAKIVNATYQSVTNALGAFTLNELNTGMTITPPPSPPLDVPLTDAEVRSRLTGLRTSLPNAEVTVFTFKPLVGVTSITDAKGETTSYEYDAFGRLDVVKDKNGNILSENQYNYKP